MRALAAVLLVACSAAKPGATGPREKKEATLVVAGGDGVTEVGLDGKPRRVLSRVPARAARRLPDGGLVFLSADLREVRRVDAKGTETVLGTLADALPPCEAKGKKGWRTLPVPLVELDLMANRDFAVDGDAVCLMLQDRRGLDARIHMVARFGLTVPGVALGYSFPGKCEQAAPRCFTTLKREDLKDLGGAPAGYRSEGRSPSRRWTLLSTGEGKSDAEFRELFLRDDQTGAITPLLVRGEPLDASGDTEIRWLPGSDLLLVENILVIPGKQVIELPGDVIE